FLHLKSCAVIDRRSSAALDEEITQFGEQSAASACGRSVAEDGFPGFAGNYRARRRYGIEQGSMGLEFQSMHVKVTHGNGNATANFLRNLQAGLFAVRRAQVSIEIVGEAYRTDRQIGDLTGGNKIIGGRDCSGSADGGL